MPESQPIVIATGLDMAMAIYLDGLMTGVSSALANFRANWSETQRDAIAEDMVRAMENDPAVMETLRQEVRDRLLGIDGEPKNITTFGGDL